MTTPEWRHIEAFRTHFERCGLSSGESVTILSEAASRGSLVHIARLAAQSLGGRVIDLTVPTPHNPHAVPIRSTGASQALAKHPAALGALYASDLIIDCTVEGLLHAPELGGILASGARVLMISNEHPDVFDRLRFDPDLARRVDLGDSLLRAASTMTVTSDAGTNLTIALAGAFSAGSTGVTNGPGSIAHWPGGLVLAFPASHTVAGTLVLAAGDLNLTFGRYIERPVRLVVDDDHITSIEGDGVDAALFESYLSAFGDSEAYAVSHVGWGMNQHARWDAAALYDTSQVWGTEARAFAGNFLFSCGANEVAGRFTAGHFDLPMRNCTVTLLGPDHVATVVVDTGTLHHDLSGPRV